MVFEQIEKLKQQYTDKYVQVDSQRPELARFKDVVGFVRTVNMSGRALVEFGEYHDNIGWYDIDIDFLKVVDKPVPKVVEKKAKAASKPAPSKSAPSKSASKAAATGGKKLSPLELARMQGAAKPGGSAAKDKPAIADVLAAARVPKGTAASEAQPAAPTAAAKPKTDRSKMSVADMIAAARGEKSGGAEAPPAQEPVAPAAAETPTETAETPTETAATDASAPTGGDKVDRSSMSVDDMIAWCREHDGK